MSVRDDGNTAVAVAFIVPARNEEKTVGRVAAACLGAAAALDVQSDVIVVSDGSVDATARIARSAGARCVELPVGKGSKARALEAGVQATTADLLVFVDGDCLGLEPQHLEHLIALYAHHESSGVGMAVGTFDYKRTRRVVQIVPWSTGQRVMRRSLFTTAASKADEYDIEIAMNETTGLLGLATVSTVLTGVRQRSKVAKAGRINGIVENIQMWRAIAARSADYDRRAYRRYAKEVMLADMPSLRVRRAPRFATWLGSVGLEGLSRVLGIAADRA